MQVEKKSDVIETWVSALIHAELNNKRKPLLSQRYNVQNMDTAYKIQTEYVRWKLQQGDTISGYKAALTAEAGQKLFGAAGPGSGYCSQPANVCLESLWTSPTFIGPDWK